MDNDEGEEMHLKKLAEERQKKDSSGDDANNAEQDTESSTASRE